MSVGRTFIFGRRRYVEGRDYAFDDMPPSVRRDVLAQAEEIESVLESDPREVLYRFLVVSPEDLKWALRARYGERLQEELARPETRRLARSIERSGLREPPVGEEGWRRALAALLLGIDLPYFHPLPRFEAPEPVFVPTLNGPAKGELPEPIAREIREGFWRMLERIHLGIPGFVGSGRVDGGQFVGGLAGMNTAWVLRPRGMPLYEAVPIAGFYLFGAFWPQVLKTSGMTGKTFDIVVGRLEKEFGRTPEYELLKGTLPLPLWESPPELI